MQHPTLRHQCTAEIHCPCHKANQDCIGLQIGTTLTHDIIISKRLMREYIQHTKPHPIIAFAKKK